MNREQNADGKDARQIITDQIVEAIENGAGKWQMPWHRGLYRPINIDTGKAYRGINIVALWAASCLHGYNSHIWGTARQWQNKGCQVRKDEESSLVFFYMRFKVKNPETQIDEARQVGRASRVFNANQVDGYNAEPSEPKDSVQAVAEADDFVANTQAVVRHGGVRAYYSRSEDHIQMPDKDRFISSEFSSAIEGYYGTLLHELVHWTGIKKRCDREFGKRFGDKAYAVEELVAELGAAFLCADLGIAAEPRPDHAAYIEGWAKVLKADNRVIFAAASKASQATDFLDKLQCRSKVA